MERWRWYPRDLGATNVIVNQPDFTLKVMHNGSQIWTTRGLAYERLGDKTKAAGSYARAINIRPKDEAARSGFARVGGKPGQSYDTL